LPKDLPLIGIGNWAKDTTQSPSGVSPAAAPREISIFVASSAAFSDDREDFELYFRRLNDDRHKNGFYLKIVLWENFLDAMSKTRLQDEYNKAICECDVFVSLFFTRTGKFTEEEFAVAVREFQRTGKPKVFTYFKKGEVDIDTLAEEDFKSLRAFQAKLKQLGHYPTKYTSIEDLKLKFRDQLDKLLAEKRL
jgi:internalin A